MGGSCHGIANVLMQQRRVQDGQSRPSGIVWIVHAGQLLRVTPEHLRPATDGERLLHTVTDTELVSFEKLAAALPSTQYEDLVGQAPPPDEAFSENTAVTMPAPMCLDVADTPAPEAPPTLPPELPPTPAAEPTSGPQQAPPLLTETPRPAAVGAPLPAGTSRDVGPSAQGPPTAFGPERPSHRYSSKRPYDRQVLPPKPPSQQPFLGPMALEDQAPPAGEPASSSSAAPPASSSPAAPPAAEPLTPRQKRSTTFDSPQGSPAKYQRLDDQGYFAMLDAYCPQLQPPAGAEELDDQLSASRQLAAALSTFDDAVKGSFARVVGSVPPKGRVVLPARQRLRPTSTKQRLPRWSGLRH